MKFRPLILLCFVAFFFSCNKKDKTASRTELLTSGSWKVIAIMSDYDANGTYETDEYAAMPDCVRDNYIVFAGNGTAESNEGPTKCDMADPQAETLSWNFSNNETNIVIDFESFTILDLSTTVLKLRSDLGSGATTVITLNHR